MKRITHLKYAIAIAAITCSFNAFAMENGNCSYPNGSEDFLAHFNNEGLNIVNYTSYRHNSDFRDNSGNKENMRFDCRTYVDTIRVIYNTKMHLFGGTVGINTLFPIVSLHLKTPGGKDSDSGLADVVVGMNDAFHSKNTHVITGVDFTLPTGSYDKNNIANVGKNYYVIEPYLITQYISNSGYEIGGKLMYDYNTENTDTEYKSGQEIHMDYVAGKHFGPYNLGIGGYLYKQITNDRDHGATVHDYKAQAAGIGPVFKYDYKNAAFTLKYIKDFAVENKASGDEYWFKINYAF